MRLRNIDFFKGALILFVILGHVLQGQLDESLWRTLIYSFHMPLFIGVSGFLLNTDKLLHLKLIGLFEKYKFRVILPWVIAVIAYYIISVFYNGVFGISSLIKAFIYPFYHLWFIPAFLSWIALTWILKKFNSNNLFLLVTALAISIITSVLSNFPWIYEGQGLVSSGLKLVLFTFRPYFYFFFVVGIFYKNIKLEKPKVMEYILPLATLILEVYLFYYPNKIIHVLNFFVLNFLLINLILKISANNLLPEYRKMEWIGLNSLAIYLWHVLPILASKFLVGTNRLLHFYICSIVLEFIFIWIYKQLIKIRFLKKYVFGM